MGTPWEVSGAAHLPEAVVAAAPDAAIATSGRAATLIRLEGFAPSIAYRAEKLKAQFAPLGEISVLQGESAERLWRAVRDAAIFDATMHPVWRVSVAPSAGPAVIAAVRNRHESRHFYDWSGGLVWIEATDEAQDRLAHDLRAAVAAAGGGHATLVRGSPALRSASPALRAAACAARRPVAPPEGAVRPARHPQSGAHGGRAISDAELQTSFSLAQLADPHIKEADSILRRCVHCGFCTATCPTYLELGNELDSPRGRIYLIKDMLENDKPASSEVALHIDRCLSCLSCVTTCPSGVDYMHLVDQARVRIEKTYRRPLHDRLLRGVLAWMLPHEDRFRAGLILAWSPSRWRRSWSSSARRAPAWPRCCALPRARSRASALPGGGCSSREVPPLRGSPCSTAARSPRSIPASTVPPSGC